MSAPDTDDVMTDADLAPRLGVSASTLRHWRGRGEGPPYYRLGAKAIRYRWAEVQEWMDENRKVPA